MLFAESAVFLKLHSVGMLLLVFGKVVVALFALGACQDNLNSCSFLSHSSLLFVLSQYVCLHGKHFAVQSMIVYIIERTNIIR